MYETLTYEQLKALRDNEKITALTELKNLYPDNRDLAKHLDVAHIAVSNMVGKYLEGKQLGRKKMTEEEKAQAKAERELKKLQELQQQQLNQQQAQQTQEEETQEEKIEKDEALENNIVRTPIISEPIINEPIIEGTQPEIKNNSFAIKLDKNMTGEEAILRLSGIANSLLKENEYKVVLSVEEIGDV